MLRRLVKATVRPTSPSPSCCDGERAEAGHGYTGAAGFGTPGRG